jgi:ceramide glucosyltransferase
MWTRPGSQTANPYNSLFRSASFGAAFFPVQADWMKLQALRIVILLLPLAPFAYYAIAIYSGWRHFREVHALPAFDLSFAPPVSILKPVRGVDHGAYENFKSFCVLDYPAYEILFAVADGHDPVVPLIQELQKEFPQISIKLLTGIEQRGANPKVSSLIRLVQEARHDILVMNDSDVRVERDYLRDAVANFADPQVGVVTAFYRGISGGTLAADVDAVGVPTDSSASTLVAKTFGKIDFALGWTMATTKQHLSQIGGWEAMVDHHSDDFAVGNKIAGLGYRVALMRKPVWLVFAAESWSDLFLHELRWSTMLRNLRPAGYLGMVMTFGLSWAILAAVFSPSLLVAAGYLLTYLILRLGVAWMIGVRLLEDEIVRRKIFLVPIRDALNFVVYVCSYFNNTVAWRGSVYRISGASYVPISDEP